MHSNRAYHAGRASRGSGPGCSGSRRRHCGRNDPLSGKPAQGRTGSRSRREARLTRPLGASEGRNPCLRVNRGEPLGTLPVLRDYCNADSIRTRCVGRRTGAQWAFNESVHCGLVTRSKSPCETGHSRTRSMVRPDRGCAATLTGSGRQHARPSARRHDPSLSRGTQRSVAGGYTARSPGWMNGHRYAAVSSGQHTGHSPSCALFGAR